MIIGAHSIIYSTSPEADRAFLCDVLKLTNVDVGGGWLILVCRRRRLQCILPKRTTFTSSI
jgi:hypothetical protein